MQVHDWWSLMKSGRITGLSVLWNNVMTNMSGGLNTYGGYIDFEKGNCSSHGIQHCHCPVICVAAMASVSTKQRANKAKSGFAEEPTKSTWFNVSLRESNPSQSMTVIHIDQSNINSNMINEFATKRQPNPTGNDILPLAIDNWFKPIRETGTFNWFSYCHSWKL